MHLRIADFAKFADSFLGGLQLFNRHRNGIDPGRQVGTLRQDLSAVVIHNHARQPLTIAESLDNPAKLLVRAPFQGRLDDFL